MKFIEGNRVEIDPLKRPKKITATRFATILGLNAWSTPFEAWCEITKTYEKPFTDSIYTIAGKVIEPKICDYLRDRYFMDIKSPSDVYGSDYFKKTYGDFFPDVKAFGGMWDFLGDDFVVEVKTTKRTEDWKSSDGTAEPPLYYKLQACLYAYLLGFDDVVMTCSFLNGSDYPVEKSDGTFDTSNAERFIPTRNNTIVVEFKLSEEFPNFENDYIKPALEFWNNYVLTGISPVFDEKKDADILKELRKHTITASNDLEDLLKEADKLRSTIEKAESKIEDKKARLKEIEELVKKEMIANLGTDDKQVETSSNKYVWQVSKSVRTSLDSTTLKKELPDVFNKYQKTSEVYTLKVKDKEKEGK